MSVKKFKFVSPSVSVAEIDNSEIPKEAESIGPIVIGRASQGPGMRPVKVGSFEEFVRVFGNPSPGGKGGDVWRDGNFSAPLYGVYAAQAWLKNASPLTFVRLLGEQNANATADGEAGWETSGTPTTSVSANGGAYGLFVVASGTAANHGSASLAAVFYMDEGMIRLTGSSPDGVTIGAAGAGGGAAALVSSIGSDHEFKAIITNDAGTDLYTTAFNFDENSDKYIRKVFNANPILANADVTSTANLKTYWLGETFERFLTDTVGAGTTGDSYAFVLALGSGSYSGGDFRMGSQAAQTGWFFAQDISTNFASYSPDSMPKLFKFVALDSGEWANSNIKISIEDIKQSTNTETNFGTFTVVVREASDSDGKPVILERFTGCNLDPNSLDYIARKIGDKYSSWSASTRRYIEYGDWPNNSRYVRVEMNTDVAAGAVEPVLLPFGVYGPLKYNSVSITSGSAIPNNSFVLGSGSIPYATYAGNVGAVRTGIDAFTASLSFPTIPLRVGATGSEASNFASPSDAYWGAISTKASSTRFAKQWMDITRAKSADVDSFSDGTLTEVQWAFSLDNLRTDPGSSTNALYASTYRTSGVSLTATGSNTYASVLSAGFDRFTSPMFGGFDGLDITEKEPFNNVRMGSTEVSNYAYNTIRRAIDSVRDSEVVECNKMVIPGLTNEGLTGFLIDTCENRADALAIIDLRGDYVPNTENTDSESTRVPTVSTITSYLKSRGINSSYGCAYTSWVQIRDNINDAIVWVPPSVVALGTMASSARKTEVWFAPAGFNRGGLSEGSAGVPVVGVRKKLYKEDRDLLYEHNINSIASFPSEGIVILGQKTLQTTKSALDRVNVRQMMIEVKKQISRYATSVLFEPNIQQTWLNFTGRVNPYLASVKTRYGLYDFKVKLDETTTTPDLIDRNILYAKILLKPTRTIEYIAIDFVISNTGASFDD
jgi:hypothetical protein